MNGADVSVIIPAFNNAAVIARALKSIADQTVKPAQVVVVDDGSDDECAAIALSCRSLLDGIELIVLRQSNQGAAIARNTALAAATGRFVAFLDADDEWLPEKLERSLPALAQSDLAFVSHDMSAIQGECETPMDCARHFSAAADPFLALVLRGFVATSTVVARRDAVIQAGGFEQSLRAAQDYDLWLRLADRHGFAVLAGAYTRYHVNPVGITSNTARRRLCSLAVLHRLRPALKRRGALHLTALRALIIQYEAASAFRRQGKPWRALAEILRVPAAAAAAWTGLPPRLP